MQQAAGWLPIHPTATSATPPSWSVVGTHASAMLGTQRTRSGQQRGVVQDDSGPAGWDGQLLRRCDDEPTATKGPPGGAAHLQQHSVGGRVLPCRPSSQLWSSVRVLSTAAHWRKRQERGERGTGGLTVRMFFSGGRTAASKTLTDTVLRSGTAQNQPPEGTVGSLGYEQLFCRPRHADERTRGQQRN